jgi:hypothetical protein
MPLAADVTVVTEHDALEPLALGTEFRLPTTDRVYNQLDQAATDESCGAHTVAAAIETYLVDRHVIGAGDQLIEPLKIFEGAKKRRSLRRAREAAEAGVATSIGVQRPEFQLIDPSNPTTMIAELGTRRCPLVIEAAVGSDFLTYMKDDVYRAIGPRDLHAICLIGYGTEAETGRQYWVAKNSYGGAWGDEGYVRFLWQDPLVEPELSVHSLRGITT